MTNEVNSKGNWAGTETPAEPSMKLSAAAVNGATPTDATASLYQGQKITLSVSTSNLQANNYDSIAFELAQNDDFTILDRSKTGLIVHPDSAAKVTQTVTASDTYTLDAIVFGQASKTNLGFCRWNIDVTGTGLPDLTLNGSHLGGASTDYGYGTSTISAGELYGIKRIPGGTTTFNVAASIPVSGYQISDASKTAITTATFSACIVARHGNLDYFDFWDASHTKLNKIQSGGHDTYVWIDSDTTGKFTFYVTSNLVSSDTSSGMYSDTLTMRIGNEDPDIAQVIVGNPDSNNASSELYAPFVDDSAGDKLTLKSTQSFVVASIPQLPPYAIQPGDMLVPLVNGTPQLNSVFPADSNGVVNGFPQCFSIPVAAFQNGSNGNDYALEYLVVRNNLVTLSSQKSYQVTGAGNSGDVPPYTETSTYLAPIIVGNEEGLDIDFNMVEYGLTVKISWQGAGWAPVIGDVLTLVIVFNGSNSGGIVHAAQPVPFPAIKSADLTNGYAQFVVDYKYFAGFLAGSSVFMQYQVPDDGTNQAGYSTATKNMNIDTVPPGGL